ncbi:MAG: hypothetical protein EOR68_03760 [Mesorhizobium sp.]|uniref:hypothetical protein n=1 Tax=Mesorhizobium sp. TaxID=1871066 RepID=UPI000FE85407|nr:hypothetical protein [Mesorhizobium sp.]RWM04332.1 MAG: hypothetical protein EOR68_03760 [Mesorhizobium sp.]TIP51672.1 MAG: hypothetical protein E5X77_00670 [Mesorhizobium sp.]
MSNAHYNGYSWQQRAKIMPAYRRLTGRNAPFEGEPCAMCSDPDRPQGEWHSEDYSEPFSFQPPESYPLCKPCHARLHKRFNSVPGEWELFCLHLEAGGYGSEFVKLRSLPDRQALSERIAAGHKVELPVIRARQPGSYWWRSLTLDPESLVAPWARPRPLRPRPDEAAFRLAFEEAGLSDRDIAFLRVHADAPRRTVTMRLLAQEALSKDDPKTANLLYGKLAGRLTSLLQWEPDLRDDGSPIWMSLLAEGWWPPGREYEWTMVPSVAEAVRSLVVRKAA